MYDINYAWVLYIEGGAVGVGYKRLSDFYLWPVRGNLIKAFYPNSNLYVGLVLQKFLFVTLSE